MEKRIEDQRSGAKRAPKVLGPVMTVSLALGGVGAATVETAAPPLVCDRRAVTLTFEHCKDTFHDVGQFAHVAGTLTSTTASASPEW